MDQITITIDDLLSNKQVDPNLFYKNLSNYKLQENDIKHLNELVFPKIYYLYEKQILRKDFVYLSLLASENNKLLQLFLDYDKSIFKVNIKDPASLYNYFIYYKQHWFYHLINTINEQRIDSKSLYTKIQLLKLIQLTNAYVLNFPEINALLLQTNPSFLDDFWRFYLKEVDRLVDVMNFCKNDKHKSEIISYGSRNSLLNTLSNFMNLNEAPHDSIIKKISSLGDNHQLEIFIGFNIMATLINLLLRNNYNASYPKDHVNSIIEDVKNKLLQLENKQLQIELLENIFCLIFHRTKNEFTCKEKEVRCVFYLLKVVIDENKFKKLYNPNSDEYKRLANLGVILTDAIWRLDLIIDVKNAPKVEDQLLNYMLASPPSLVHICLKRQHFHRAYQVIKIANLTDSVLDREIRYTDQLQTFRKSLQTHQNTKTIAAFFARNPPASYANYDELQLDHTSNIIATDGIFMDLFDLALTHPNPLIFELLEGRTAPPSTYRDFYESMREIVAKGGERLPGILLSSRYPLAHEAYAKKARFFSQMALHYDRLQAELECQVPGVLNKNHNAHKTFLLIAELCSQYVPVKEPSLFLLKVYNYLRAFSQVVYIEENASDIISCGLDASFFALLNFNRSELTGKLLFERHLDPTEFEKYFTKLKLDFLYHVVGNCFPTINLHVQENVTIEELYHDNMLYIPSPSIISYIQKRNWLLAFILNEMYRVEGVRIDISEVRLQKFFNFMKLARIQSLKVLFERNEIVTALQNCISSQKVKCYFEEQIVKQDLMSITSDHSCYSNDEFESAEEVQEDTKITNWICLFNVIDSVPENQLRKKNEFIKCRNSILVNLVQECFEQDLYKFVRFISNREVRIGTILGNVKKWPGQFAIDIIKAEIMKFDAVDDPNMDELKLWLRRIELCEKVKTIFEQKTWYKTYELCKRETDEIIRKIIHLNDINIVLEFIELYNPTELFLINIDATYITQIIELDTPLAKVKNLLDHLPFAHAINVCNNLLVILRNLDYLNFVTNYLRDNVTDDITLQNVQISLKMLTVFVPAEQEQLFCLINTPLSILEVLLMNTKLDKLAAVLDVLNPADLHKKYDKSVISIAAIDSLLRQYAKKSLDFRVILQPNAKLSKPTESKLLQSLDSLNLTAEKTPFIVPESAPRKDEWVRNEDVLDCMCCQQITFSMFNRRHHCRRCGRVVCYHCSQKRMLVESYGDILVRACLDCYEQTIGHSCSSERSDAPSSQYFNQEYWLLNDNREHNKIIREEFSYEHAPSISLCLSILKYHSKCIACPLFLLEQCELMLDLVKPKKELTPELDYLLVIKMIKSLAIAAKMLANDNMLDLNSFQADRIISQAELLALLVEKGCLNSISTSNTDVDALVLRVLRDKLLQREQWKLALEVSTKAGLDNIGVFAAWGKSCLKAGSLLLAREKFQRCLDRCNAYDPSSSNLRSMSELNKSTDSLLNASTRSRFSSRLSVHSTASDRPAKNPQLLNEIIQILETKTRSVSAPVLNASSHYIKISDSTTSLNQLAAFTLQTDTAISIMNRIKNLAQIASGQFSLARPEATRLEIDPIFYEECVYYLNKYGTHQSLLEFYVKHDDVGRALRYISDNRLPTEVFNEMYMICLREGAVQELQEQMSRIDSSLDLWKDYLKQICRFLEQQNLLNCLYQLQLHVGDYVRAAMTCIRFYRENVKNFSELANNVGFLQKGELHLAQVLELEQWVEVTSVGKVSLESKGSFEEKMLANPDLIMKIDSKDVHKHKITFRRQIEVVGFLAQCESGGVKTASLVKDLQAQLEIPSGAIPTLFDSTSDKIILAAMAMISGENIDDGFPLAIQIIKDFKLRPIKVYCVAGKQLAKMEQYKGITQLVNCIKSTGISDAAVSDMLDEMLTQAVGTLIKADVSGTKVEDLIKLIKDRAMKISAYIEVKQLKTAYFLAVKYKRTADIRRIQHEAELLNMPTIKALCQKVLQSSQTTTHSKD